MITTRQDKIQKTIENLEKRLSVLRSGDKDSAFQKEWKNCRDDIGITIIKSRLNSKHSLLSCDLVEYNI